MHSSGGITSSHSRLTDPYIWWTCLVVGYQGFPWMVPSGLEAIQAGPAQHSEEVEPHVQAAPHRSCHQQVGTKPCWECVPPHFYTSICLICFPFQIVCYRYILCECDTVLICLHCWIGLLALSMWSSSSRSRQVA